MQSKHIRFLYLNANEANLATLCKECKTLKLLKPGQMAPIDNSSVDGYVVPYNR